MEALKFTISGTTAHFKKPQVNSINLTFTHIHKVALLGILGNIIWLGGWRNKAKDELPEFYKKLKDLRISIVPNKNIFPKTIKQYCNSTGFANKDSNNNGANLMVREQCLVKPSWDIYVMDSDIEEFRKIREFILESKSYGTLYLGKTHHPADINHPSIVNLQKAKTISKIHSLFKYNDVSVANVNMFFNEYVPVKIDNKMNYIYEEMAVSDGMVVECVGEYYKCDDRVLYFN